MALTSIKYQFRAAPWKYSGSDSWTFISLPKNISREIRKSLKHEEEGWGRLKVIAKIGDTEWKTAIWFDTKVDTYILPLKKDIRQKENIELNKTITATLLI